jgi:hypothetical protein
LDRLSDSSPGYLGHHLHAGGDVFQALEEPAYLFGDRLHAPPLRSARLHLGYAPLDVELPLRFLDAVEGPTFIAPSFIIIIL